MNVTATTVGDILGTAVGTGQQILETVVIPAYFDYYAGPIASILNTLFLGFVPHSILMPSIHAVTGSIIFGAVAPLYMEWLYQYTKFWFDRGVVKRYQNALPDDRDFVTNFFAAISIALPFAFWRAFNDERVGAKTVYRIDVLSIIVFHYIVFFAMDIWYFFGHRYCHKNKFLWKYVHSHHHEKKNVNVSDQISLSEDRLKVFGLKDRLKTFSTGYAAFVENLILVGPVILFSAIVMDTFWTDFDRIAFEMAWFSQFKVFILGHSGMRMHLVMYFPWVFSGLQQVFGSFSQIPEDHEMHHVYVMSNFALNFRFMDRWFGSYKPIEYVMDRRKAAEAAEAAKSKGASSEKTE
ncbi:hypothetical protein HK102_006297 [Quaeritorhiza haematococci]|nr:hypothetical protein HK102_006297 [Quaeritorhiza haematococci]